MPDLWSQLFRDFTTAAWGERWDVLEQYGRITGKSRNTLLRRLKQMGFDSGRACNGNGGDDHSLTDDQVNEIAAIIRTSRSKKNRMAMDTFTAMLAASHTGVIDAGAVSEGTVRRLMREQKVSKRHQLEPTPHVAMRSLHPNHVHQVDATHCVQYYLQDKGLEIRDPDLEQLYKPEKMRKIKRHLIRYLLVDHFSGAFYVRYYYSAGENWHDLFDFLFSRAWREKPEFIREKYPFAHVPRMLIWDAGSANSIINRILDRLEVEHRPHLPGNPRVKGAVETMMWIWEQKFESLLRLAPAASLEDLNHKALDMCAYINATMIHTRTGMTRSALWSSIKAEDIRILPPLEVIQSLAHSRPDKRIVEGNLVIRYNGLSYDLRHVPGIARGDRVEVTVNPYRHPDVTIAYEGRKYSASAVQFLPGIQGGFRADAAVWGQEYKSQKDTPAMKAGKEMDAEARRDAPEKKTGLPFLGELHRELEPIMFIDRSSRASEIPLAADVQARDIPRLKAAKWIREELGDAWRPWMAQTLKEEYGDTVPEMEIAAIMERLQEKGERIKEQASRNGR